MIEKKGQNQKTSSVADTKKLPKTASKYHENIIESLKGSQDASFIYSKISTKQVKIEISHFNFSYGDNQALHDVNLLIPKQKVTAMIGPSGCGKSTLIRCINRMNDIIPYTRHTGSIHLDNRDIYSKQENVINLRYQVGMIFQKSNPFPKSIFDNVAYGPRIRGIRNKLKLAEIVEEALEHAGLINEVKDRMKDSALKLSGGQQQRLCIARALATKPSVMLMDEPTSALDPISTAKLEELILSLKLDYTIIIVTHNMQQAARVSDLTAFLYEGKIIEYNPTKTIFTNPAVKQTEDYITGRFG